MINLQREIAGKLRDAGIDNYKNESIYLIEHFLKVSKNDILFSQNKVEESEKKELENAVNKRISGEPLQYILGTQPFFELDFFVGSGVLIPRFDTEILVETALKKCKKEEKNIVMDLCSGSGCIAISLEKKLKNSEVYAIEKSVDAYYYLEKNTNFHSSKINHIKGDVLDEKMLESTPLFDIIVSNPPYLTSKDMKNLQEEVKFEPETALFGGEDGLDFYRKITEIWKNKLKNGGVLLFEIGENQEKDVEIILLENGFKDIFFERDLSGLIRVVGGLYKNK